MSRDPKQIGLGVETINVAPTKSSPRYWVPADTPASVCDGPRCQKEVFWITLPSKKKGSIDCSGEGHWRPTKDREGYGVLHFVTCVDRDRFRKKGKP